MIKLIKSVGDILTFLILTYSAANLQLD